MNQNFIIIMNQKCQIYSIKIYVGKKTPNLQQNLREEKNTKFTTSKFTWEIVRKNMPNLQYQYLHEKKNAKFTTSKITWEKKHQIYNIKNYVRKKNAKFKTSKFTWEKNTKFTTSKFTWEKKRQIYNIKIYVRKKNTKIKTSKITWKKKEKFTTSLATSRTTLDVCQNTDRGKCLNQYNIYI